MAPAISSGDAPLACALLARLGAVAESDLRDDRRAAALYERAVELGHRSPELLRALDGVYGRLGDVDKQARVLSLYVEAQTREGGASAASDATYRLAALRLASKETLDEGAEMMRGALDVDPQYDRAVEIAPPRAGALSGSPAPHRPLRARRSAAGVRACARRRADPAGEAARRRRGDRPRGRRRGDAHRRRSARGVAARAIRRDGRASARTSPGPSEPSRRSARRPETSRTPSS